MPLEPGLYVAATPIGNLKDVTFRVIETLREADRILCEDTRQTGKLCAAYGVTTPRTAYHEHNAARVQDEIIAALMDGAAICLVSDAGTPLISDPGFRLVEAARAAGVNVIPLPGPSAAIAALSAAGAPTQQFFFAGFPPVKSEARLAFFKSIATVDATLIFYEGPSRIGDSLRAMMEAFGDRRAVVAREITKIHETFDADFLSGLAEKYRDGAKGEIVVIIDPPPQAEPALDADIDSFLLEAMKTMSLKDAAAATADAFALPKKAAYDRALAIKARR